MISALNGAWGAIPAYRSTSLRPEDLDGLYLGFARIDGVEHFVSALPIVTPTGRLTGAVVSSIGPTHDLYQTRDALTRNSLLILLTVLACTAAAIVVIMRRLFRPVPALIRALMRITQGDFESPTPYQNRKDEIGHLAAAIEKLREAVVEREYLMSLQEAAMRLEHMAHHDALTGLPNRAFLDRALQNAVSTLPAGDRFNLMMFDLDRFKEVNDTCGHQTGDALLVAVSDRLNLLLGPDDVAARLGGDEFVIVQKVARDARLEAEKLAARIVETLAMPFHVEGRELRIGASVGITCAPDHGENTHDLLKHADAALYAAKNAGRSLFVFYERNTSLELRPLA
jgi:diguanylate cyclase (GGDEF)-like protein